MAEFWTNKVDTVEVCAEEVGNLGELTLLEMSLDITYYPFPYLPEADSGFDGLSEGTLPHRLKGDTVPAPVPDPQGILGSGLNPAYYDVSISTTREGTSYVWEYTFDGTGDPESSISNLTYLSSDEDPYVVIRVPYTYDGLGEYTYTADFNGDLVFTLTLDGVPTDDEVTLHIDGDLTVSKEAT